MTLNLFKNMQLLASISNILRLVHLQV